MCHILKKECIGPCFFWNRKLLQLKLGFPKKLSYKKKQCKKAGLKGIVASGSEAKIIRKKYKNFFILTPGIRLPGDKVNDQSRVLTPKAALHAGASAIVLGRSIYSGKIKQNIKRLIDHLN